METETVPKKSYVKYPPHYCEICKQSISYYKWSAHIKTKKHLNGGFRPKLGGMAHCDFCNKDIVRRNFKYHELSNCHKIRVLAANMAPVNKTDSPSEESEESEETGKCGNKIDAFYF